MECVFSSSIHLLSTANGIKEEWETHDGAYDAAFGSCQLYTDSCGSDGSEWVLDEEMCGGGYIRQCCHPGKYIVNPL